jgi:hypothetical protein
VGSAASAAARLILRGVLGFSTAEAGGVPGDGTAAVNGSLPRVRAAFVDPGLDTRRHGCRFPLVRRHRIRNGASKTTTLRAISGLLKHGAGAVRLGGSDLAGVAPAARARLGIAHVPSDRGLFFGLTVAEHFRLDGQKNAADLDAAFDHFPALRPLKDRKAGLMSGGEQQMLAISRALARKPRLLMLDEMSLGLAPVIVGRLLPVVREQHVHMALKLADRGYVPGPPNPGPRGDWPRSGGALGGPLVNQAVADGLGDGQDAAASRVRPDVFRVPAGRLGYPVEQRVGHPLRLLLVGGHRRDGSAEPQPWLGQGERRVGIGEPARARGEHAERGPAGPPARERLDLRPHHVEHSHEREDGAQFGLEVLQLQPDRAVPVGVKGEQLRGQPRRRRLVEDARGEHDALLE